MAEARTSPGLLEWASAPMEPLLANFTEELGKQSRRPPGNDQVIGALCLAAACELETNETVRQVVNDLLVIRADESPSQQVGDFRAVVQNDILNDNPAFPRGDAYYRPDAWRQPLRDIGERYNSATFATASLEERSERLTYNLLSRKVQTDVPERALTVEYVMQSRRDRFAHGARWLDIGCGIMEGQSFLHNKHRFGVPSVSVEQPDGRLDRRATQWLRQLLGRDSLIQSSVGFDLADAYDPNSYLWSRGSLRPAELANRKFMDRFTAIAEERLAAKDLHHPASFFRGDIMSDSDIAELQVQTGGQKFDVVSIRTMAHQLEPEERPELLARAAELTSAEGIVLLSDFTRLRSRRHSTAKHLSFYKHWHLPFRYRSFILDMAKPERGLQEILRAKNSRCETFQITDESFNPNSD